MRRPAGAAGRGHSPDPDIRVATAPVVRHFCRFGSLRSIERDRLSRVANTFSLNGLFDRRGDGAPWRSSC
jgi:hypothetical protein